MRQRIIPEEELTDAPETWARIRWVGHGMEIWATSPFTPQALIYHVRAGHLRILEVGNRRYYDVAVLHSLMLSARPTGPGKAPLPKYKVRSLLEDADVPKALRKRMEGTGQIIRAARAPAVVTVPAHPPQRKLVWAAPKAPAAPKRIPSAPRDPRTFLAPPKRVPFTPRQA